MHIVAISNQKGGVGKTTTSINLSVGLALEKKRVLLIDLDPQANATSGLGFSPSENGSIYSCFSGEESIQSKILPSRFENLFLVPSEIDLAGFEAEIALVRSGNQEESSLLSLREILLSVQNQFDFCIFDTPPSLGILMTSALSAADEILLPLQAEWFSLEGLAKIVHLINKIRSSNLNSHLSLEGIVMTMVQKQTNISAQVIEEVGNYFPNQLYQTIIPRTVKLAEAPSHGKSIFEYQKKGVAANAYATLTKEFLKRHS